MGQLRVSNSTLIFLIPLVFSIFIAPSLLFVDFSQEADATKAVGPKATKSYGSKNSGKVCGDRLCSESAPAGQASSASREAQVPVKRIEPVSEDVIEERLAEKESQVPEDEMMEESTGEGTMEDQTFSSSILKYTKEPPVIDPEKGYFVTEIANGLYWLMGGGYQVMFLTTGEGVIVVDAPEGMGEKYLKAVAEVTDEPITHVVYSHIHRDHIGAAHIFPDDATIISHKDAADHLTMKNDPNRPVPTVTFDDTYTLSVGDQTLELSYVGAFHSKGDILIYAPQQKVLMVVDVFHPKHAPFKAFAITKDMGNYISVHDKILEYDVVAIISGHQHILGTPDDVKTNKEFTLDVMNNVAQAYQTTDFMEIAQQYGSEGQLTVFGKYLDSITNTCVDLTLENWGDKLSDVNVFVEDYCDAMLFYVSID